MILNNKPELLMKILVDPFYSFDKNWVFTYVTKTLHSKEKGESIDEIEMS